MSQLITTQWCLDCGTYVGSGQLFAICPPCTAKRIQRAQNAQRKQEEEAIREEERSQRAASDYETMMLRSLADKKKLKQLDELEKDPTHIEEGGTIQWIQ